MRWVVRPGDGATVRDVLARAGADADALRDGRVFVGRRRVLRGDEEVRADDVVHIAIERPARGTPCILLQQDDLVALDKPAGVPTIADHGGGAHTLVALAAKLLGVGPARLHPTSRLDRDVSGVVVMALTREAARRMTDARAKGLYTRRYVAIAGAPPEPLRGAWDAPIGRASDPRLRVVLGVRAAAASTLYGVSGRAPQGAALLALSPVTGRTHQLRVHAAHAGAPLLGDRSYGGPVRVTLEGGRVVEPRRIALHAARVVVPGRGGALVVAEAPVPGELRDLWSALGGPTEAWELALSCALKPG